MSVVIEVYYIDMLLEVNMARKDIAASPPVQFISIDELYPEIVLQEEIMLNHVCVAICRVYTGVVNTFLFPRN